MHVEVKESIEFMFLQRSKLKPLYNLCCIIFSVQSVTDEITNLAYSHFSVLNVNIKEREKHHKLKM